MVFVVLTLSAGLWLTVKIFLIPLYTVRLKLSGGKSLFYLGILKIESLSVF